MKLKIMIGAALVVTLGIAAFVVAGSGEKFDQEHWDRIRGTESYYADSPLATHPSPYGGEDIMVNLMDKKVIKFAFDVLYRTGGEWRKTPEMATAALAAHQAEIRSRIIIMFTSRKSADFSGASLQGLLQELIDMMNDIAFPKGMARIEEVVIKNMIMNG